MNALHKDYLFVCICGYRGCELLFNDAAPRGMCPECRSARETIAQVPLDVLLNAARNSGRRKRELRRVNAAIERANLRLFKAEAERDDAFLARYRAEEATVTAEARRSDTSRHIADLRSENQRLRKLIARDHEEKCFGPERKSGFADSQQDQA